MEPTLVALQIASLEVRVFFERNIYVQGKVNVLASLRGRRNSHVLFLATIELDPCEAMLFHKRGRINSLLFR